MFEISEIAERYAIIIIKHGLMDCIWDRKSHVFCVNLVEMCQSILEKIFANILQIFCKYLAKSVEKCLKNIKIKKSLKNSINTAQGQQCYSLKE